MTLAALYHPGTVTFTNGSADIIGVGTDFTHYAKGDVISIPGFGSMQLASDPVSATLASGATAWQAATAATKNYDWIPNTGSPSLMGERFRQLIEMLGNGNVEELAALALVADRLPYADGSGSLALTPFTSAGRALVDDADAAAQRVTLGLDTVVAYIVQTLTDAQKVIARANIGAGIDVKQMFRGLAAKLFNFELRLESLERSRQYAAAKIATGSNSNVGTGVTVIATLSFTASSPVMMIAGFARMANGIGSATTGYAYVDLSGLTPGPEGYSTFPAAAVASLTPIQVYTGLTIGTIYTVNLRCRQATATAGFAVLGTLMAWSI